MTAIPFLAAEELAGAGDVLGEKLTMHPLDQLFPRIVHDGPSIEFRLRVMSAYAADNVGADAPANQAKSHDIRVINGEPLNWREARHLTNSEVSFFRRYDQLKKTNMLTGTHQSRRGQILTDVAREAMMPVKEGAHRLKAEALQGSVTYRLGGVNTTTSYGLTALTKVGTAWSNAAAPIVTDVYELMDEFETNANVPPDTVIFNPRIWSQYFAGNTEFTTYVKQSPRMAEAFLGQGGGIRPMQQIARAPFTMFGMVWVPVWGSYVDRDGATQARWPLDKLTMLALNAGDGQQVLEWGSVRDEYCPEGQGRYRTRTEDNPIRYAAEYADNGIPIIRIQERVQTVDLTP